MLRVLWVTNMFYEEGSRDFRGIFVTQLWDSLQATGRVELAREVVAQGRGSKDYLAANWRVRQRWATGAFDLVHVHYGLTGLATMMLPTPVPRLFTFYGSDINDSVQRTISVATARRARRVFVAQRLADQWPDPDNLVIPNGVDFEQVRPAPREEACAALGLDPSRRYVLFGGNPRNEVKGYPEFEAVLRRVQESRPEATELVLSEPNQPYERVVQKLNAADLLLFTSKKGTEGSPTVVKEAAVAGLPVVTVDVGDAAETLAGVQPGAVVPWPADESDAARQDWQEALATEVARVLDAGVRSNGREMRSELRQDRIAERVLAVYEDLAAAARRGAPQLV